MSRRQLTTKQMLTAQAYVHWCKANGRPIYIYNLSPSGQRLSDRFGEYVRSISHEQIKVRL